MAGCASCLHKNVHPSKAIRGGIMMLFPDSHYSKDEIAELNHDWLDWIRQEAET